MTVDEGLAEITAEHLSRPTLDFLRAVHDERVDVQPGLVDGKPFTLADWTNLEDLTADELLDSSGSVTSFGAAVLRFAFNDDYSGADCGT